jgi:hypothetical protein
MTLFVGAGPAYRIAIGRTLELGARTDLLLLQHAAARNRPVETTHARWIGAADLVLEAGWSLGPHAGICAGVGAELAFGTTTLNVGGMPVADIPPVRGVGELGARFRF